MCSEQKQSDQLLIVTVGQAWQQRETESGGERRHIERLQACH
jgi:hypothetical protein